jgi:predicted GNAT superfamily acetyltransferase
LYTNFTVFTNPSTAVQERSSRDGATEAGIDIRPLSSNEDYDEAVRLQDEIWGAGFSDRVPASILRVGQKVGGVSAAAFDADGHMLGFVFGLTGVRNGRLAHWSDMLAVREAARGHHLGDRLKHYQRDVLRAIGVETMFWTFDPLVARNAHFNLNRLGARIAEYVPNFYGANTGSILHGALPTDRFIAEWPLGASDVDASRPTVVRARPTLDVATSAIVEDGHVHLVDPFPETSRVLVPVPVDIEAALGASATEALAWRLATRHAMMHCLARGYRVVGFHRATDRELPAYELALSTQSSA